MRARTLAWTACCEDFSWTSPNDLTDDPEKSYIANRNPPQFIPKCVVCKGVAIENFLIGVLCFDGPLTPQQGWAGLRNSGAGRAKSARPSYSCRSTLQ